MKRTGLRRATLPIRSLLLVHNLWHSIQAQVLPNMLCQSIVNFGMTRHCLFLPSPGISVNVVSRARTHQYAAIFQELLDEFLSLHTAMAFTLYASGTSSIAICK
jgi:hypothetical protein